MQQAQGAFVPVDDQFFVHVPYYKPTRQSLSTVPACLLIAFISLMPPGNTAP